MRVLVVLFLLDARAFVLDRPRGLSKAVSRERPPSKLPRRPEEFARLPQALREAVDQECPQDVTQTSQGLSRISQETLHGNRSRMLPRFGQHLTGTLQLYPRNPPKGNRPRLAPGIRLDSPRTLQHLPKDSSRQSSMNAPQNVVGPSRGLYQTSQALPQDVTQDCPQDLPNISQALCRPSPRSSHGNRPRMPQHVTETSRDST